MAMISKTVTGSAEDMKYVKNAKNYRYWWNWKIWICPKKNKI